MTTASFILRPSGLSYPQYTLTFASLARTGSGSKDNPHPSEMALLREVGILSST